MNNYIPFLKFKANEIGALSTLSQPVKALTYPFLDLPKKDGMSEVAFLAMIAKAKAAFHRHLKDFPAVFIDNYDIDDSITVNGGENYLAVIDSFGECNQFVPVVALDRTQPRNDVVFQAKAAGKIASSTIAIRLQAEDILSFPVVEADLLALQLKGANLFSFWTLIIDNRVCLTINESARSAQINKFLALASGKINISAVIIAGSSIPASISELMKVLSEVHHPRPELSIYRQVASAAHHPSIHLGDYTVVSPLYSDVNIPAEAMQNVIAAKTIYTYGDYHYIIRGGALKTHARGRLQYNDIAGQITAKSFYRGPHYSFGDLFLHEKSQHLGKGVTPGSILKPTINAHITFMLTGFPG